MTLALSEVQRGLGLFAESLGKQIVRIETLEPDEQGWPWDLSLPSPVVVRLEPAMQTGSTLHERRRVYRTQVLHHVAMIEFGSFGPDPTAPDPEAATHHPTITASALAPAASLIVVLLEHHRIANRTMHHYPGSSADHDRLLRTARSSVHLDDEFDGAGGVITALRLLCTGGSRAELLLASPSVDPETVDRLLMIVAPLTHPSATLDHSAAVAVEIARLLADETVEPKVVGERFAPVVDDADDTETDLEPEDLDGMSTSTPPLDAEADRVGDDLEGMAQASPIPHAAEVEELERSTDTRNRRPPGPTRNEIAPAERTFLYDEWNYLDRTYERSWCRLIERRVEGDEHDFITDVRRRHAGLRQQIRRQFAMLRPRDRVRVHRQDDGDELDIDAAIEAIVDRRSGVPADDRLNIRRDRAARQVATAFLIDLSASTSSPAVPPEPPPPGAFDDEDDDDFDPFMPRPPVYDEEPVRRVIDVAKDAVALMCDALDQLGDRHAVYGFSGQGRRGVEFCVGKEFDDRPGPTTWAALAGMSPISYTRMGPAIRHAAKKLASQEVPTRLLIVISDGYPQDVDYGPDRRDKDYGLHDTAKAIAEATVLGVDTFCVTIDPAGHDYLRVLSPDHRYLVIDEVESLPSELAKLYLDVSGMPRVADGF